MEIKEIEGFSNYLISDSGEVFSKNYNRMGIKRKLKPLIDKYGYLYVRLSIKRNITKHKTIHRLVAEAFILNLENKPQVNHKDGNKKNNFVKNLEWATAKENIGHSYKNGLQKPNITNAKINFKIAQQIRKRILDGERVKDLAKEFGFYPGNISAIKHNRIWKKE